MCITGTRDIGLIETIFKKCYKEFIEAVDANDNGILPYDEKPKFNYTALSLPKQVSMLNPRWNEVVEDKEIDARFEKASLLMGQAFENTVQHLYNDWCPARNLVFKACLQAKLENRILELEQYIPWKDHIFDFEEENNCKGRFIYVLYPDDMGFWRIHAVPEYPGSFNTRMSLPEDWRGLRDLELSTASNIPNSIFVHANGFIGGNKTYEGALNMAQRSLNYK